MAKKTISILQGQFYTMTQKKLLRPPNTDGIINCLRQPGQLDNQPIKSMRVNSVKLIKFFSTMTNPAIEIKSIGLPAIAQLSRFLLSHLDSFIMTRQLLNLYPDSSFRQFHLDEKPIVHQPGPAKTSPARTRMATNYTTGPLGAIMTDY